MRSVRSSDTSPEIAFRKALFARGFRYRLHAKGLPGRPDIAFPGRRAVIFVHGCFWHGHGCARGKRAPKSNARYWRAKIAGNVKRDKAVIDALRKRGWRVYVAWECRLKDMENEANKASRWLLSEP